VSPSRPCCTSGARLSGWVDLEGAVNVRDVGGLPLDGGGVTASGVLLRSDNLQGLTQRDVAVLEDLGVGTVVDLRTGGEVELEGPGPLVGRVDIRHRSLYPEKGARTDVAVEDIMIGNAPIVDVYLGYLNHRPDSIVGALEDIAAGEGAVLVHCAAGKDRTGIVVAFALAAAGVSREAIVADYVATAERISLIMARLRASPTYAADLDDEPDEAHAPRAETMEAVFDALDSRHGGPLEWLAGHGFDPSGLPRRLVASP
jgi:protein-tyrosine phosphatase